MAPLYRQPSWPSSQTKDEAGQTEGGQTEEGQTEGGQTEEGQTEEGTILNQRLEKGRDMLLGRKDVGLFVLCVWVGVSAIVGVATQSLTALLIVFVVCVWVALVGLFMPGVDMRRP
jgi:hypothetical protein